MIPSLFIAHGSPMVVIEDSPYALFLAELGKTFPRPKAIVFFSAHWESTVQMVSDVVEYATLYDFGCGHSDHRDVGESGLDSGRAVSDWQSLVAASHARCTDYRKRGYRS